MNTITKKRHLYWLAGLLEGEGCFSLQKRWKQSKYDISLSLQMTDKDVVQQAAELMKVPMYGPVKHLEYKLVWAIHIRGQRAIDWAKKLYPLLSRRRKAQIDKALSKQTKRNPAYLARWRVKRAAALAKRKVLPTYIL